MDTLFDNKFKLKVDVDEWIQQHLFFFGVYDEAGINFLKKTLKADYVFIDIGANIGTYSISASNKLDKSKGGMVHAFEPVSYVYKKLIENIELNKIENIVPNNLAVFQENKTIELFLSNQENLGMSSVFHHDTESGLTEMVEAVTIDSYIEISSNITRVDLIKIDIEGAELFALKGMLNTLKKFKPVLLLEISENVLKGNSISSSDVFNFLDQLGYSPYTIEKSGEIKPFNVERDELRTNYVFQPIN
jgi:FkbM family methyltransferase